MATDLRGNRGMSADHPERFISEAMTPVPSTGRASAAARGEPALPERFTWRGTEYRVAGVIEQWKTTGPCRSGSPEQYVRRHWYRVRTEPPAVMTVYCDRQARDRKRPRARWWVYSASATPEGSARRQSGERQ